MDDESSLDSISDKEDTDSRAGEEEKTDIDKNGIELQLK